MYVNDPNEFDCLNIGLASPDRIRYWSFGEVEKPETINYRTFKPERKGLFCEKIFGPVKDWECSCGKYRRIRYRGIVCERCGVEVTHSKVRRERMGHLELAAPVTHIWFLKGIPSFLGTILDMTSRQLEEIIYYDSYIILDLDESLSATFQKYQLLSTSDHAECKAKYGNKLKTDIGAGAIKKILEEFNIQQEVNTLRESLESSKGQKRLKIIKRLRILESFMKSGNSPEWLVLDVIPIMPPELRPMVQLEGGRFATSDLNDLYRRVVNRNNRLKRLLDIGAPEMIIRNEKRMLQESVDVLISNGKRGRSVTGANGRPLKSLGNIIEGKQGRFRQNLLGKRVDYSARSVIVVGPHLEFNKCGLPKEMALELFKPFVIRKLVSDGIASNVKGAKRKIENRDLEVWAILEKVIQGKLVLLNRAPTLHRLGIQAFEPILVEGSAIQIHPLVCTAFNADFDGDQMAVHLPLSIEAQAECKLLIESTNNILSPSSGNPIVTPTQDMVLGCYYLTVDNEYLDDKNLIYKDVEEAQRAFDAGYIKYHTKLAVRIDGKIIKTTMGRIIFNNAIKNALAFHNITTSNFVNFVVGKGQLADIVFYYYQNYGNKVTSSVINNLKKIGFKYSTQSGLSISVDDLTIPDSKAEIIEKANNQIKNLDQMETRGIISATEKKSRSSEIWRTVTQNVSNELSLEMGKLNNVYIMANSGARGNMDQVRQLAGMRGLMSDSQGRTIDIPILHNFKEGLTLTEYFISAYGARKGLVDTALRTADSGYLTRRLVDIAQDVMVTIEDCNTSEGIDYKAVMSGVQTLIPLSEIIEGKVSLGSVKVDKKTIIKKGDLITKDQASLVSLNNFDSIKARSIYTCKAEKGICQQCYGIDLSTARLVNLGEAVGIIAAQSIGEPGTQLTMRTFHTGGVDLRKSAVVPINSPSSGKVSIDKLTQLSNIESDNEKIWIVSNDGELTINNGNEDINVSFPAGSKLLVKDKQEVKEGQTLLEYDPNETYYFAISSGEIYYNQDNVVNFTESKENGAFAATQTDELYIFDKNNKSEILVSGAIADSCEVGKPLPIEVLQSLKETKSYIVQKIVKLTDNSKRKSKEFRITLAEAQSYPFYKGAIIFAQSGSKTSVGNCLILQRSISDVSKTEDIVQGLPKVEELFEARKPKDAAILSEVSGVVNISSSEIYWFVNVMQDSGETVEHKIPKTAYLSVFSGKEVLKGEPLSFGPTNPHDLAKTVGIDATRTYLTDEVQKVYRSQGVQINKKHIEVIVRQMTKKVVVTDMGDSTLLLNEMIDIKSFDKICKEIPEGQEIPKSEPVLLGITRASLSTDSFISASSFQQTAGVLTRAAIEGQSDPMEGLKENVIIGKLIPAGTGKFLFDSINFAHSEDYLKNNQEDDDDENNDENEDSNSEKKDDSSKKKKTDKSKSSLKKEVVN